MPRDRPHPSGERPPLRGRDSDARLVAILMVLLGGGHANGEELAARFGVAPRTIYRDIEALKRRGFPIVSSVGPGGGYVLQPRGAEPNQALTTEAGFASLLTDSGPFATVERADDDVLGVLDRAESALDRDEKKALDRVRERIFFDTEEWYVRDFAEPHFDALREAVLHDRVVELRFRDRTGSAFEDVVHPIGLVWKAGFWYVFVRRSDQTYERIRLERLERLTVTKDTFRRPRRSLVDLWREDLAQFGVGTTTVRLVITGSAIREFQHFNWKDENTIKKRADQWDVEMHVDNYDWLIPIALANAGDVEIVEPSELRQRVAVAATQVARRHGADQAYSYSDAEARALGQKGDIRSRAVRAREP